MINALQGDDVGMKMVLNINSLGRGISPDTIGNLYTGMTGLA